MRNVAVTLWLVVTLTACSSVARVGARAPGFDEETAQGTMLSMGALAGKPVWLNFFATWCPPCNEEAPAVQSVADEFKPKGLQVIGIDVLENAAKAKAFTSEHHLRFPAVVDTGALRDAYNINGMPVNVFIDKDGIIRDIEIGQLERSDMVADVKKIL